MKSLYRNLLIASSFGLLFTACGSDSSSSSSDDPSSSSVAESSSSTEGSNTSTEDSSDAKKFAFSFKVSNGQYFGTGNLTDDQAKLVKNFKEGSSTGTVAYYDGSVYALMLDDSQAYSTLSRYELDENNEIGDKPAATFKTTDVGPALMLKFIDENKMYVICPYADMLMALNPKTLEVTGSVQFETDSGAVMAMPGSSVLRDGKLYVTLAQAVDASSGMGAAYGTVAIVDVATDKVEKVIHETKTAYLGGFDELNNPTSFVDEKGDIYFYSVAMFGMVEGYNEGFVRIKNGEDEFDTSYVLHLQEVSYDGKSSNSGTLMQGGAVYAGNGKFLALFGSFEDPTNYENFEWQPVVIDVYEGEMSKLDLEPTLAWLAPSFTLDTDGTVLFGHTAKSGSSYIYRYNAKTEKLTQAMTIETGYAYIIVPLSE